MCGVTRGSFVHGAPAPEDTQYENLLAPVPGCAAAASAHACVTAARGPRPRAGGRAFSI